MPERTMSAEHVGDGAPLPNGANTLPKKGLVRDHTFPRPGSLKDIAMQLARRTSSSEFTHGMEVLENQRTSHLMSISKCLQELLDQDHLQRLLVIEECTKQALDEIQKLSRRSKDNAQDLTALKRELVAVQNKDNAAVEEIKRIVACPNKSDIDMGTLYQRLDKLAVEKESVAAVAAAAVARSAPVAPSFDQTKIITYVEDQMTEIMNNFKLLSDKLDRSKLEFDETKEKLLRENEQLAKVIAEKCQTNAELETLDAELSTKRKQLESLDEQAERIQQKVQNAKSTLEAQKQASHGSLRLRRNLNAVANTLPKPSNLLKHSNLSSQRRHMSLSNVQTANFGSSGDAGSTASRKPSWGKRLVESVFANRKENRLMEES